MHEETYRDGIVQHRFSEHERVEQRVCVHLLASEHRQRGHRVCRTDDRTKKEAFQRRGVIERDPLELGEAVEQVPKHDVVDDGTEDGEGQDRAEILKEVLALERVPGVENDWRQDDEEDQVGVELENGLLVVGGWGRGDEKNNQELAPLKCICLGVAPVVSLTEIENPTADQSEQHGRAGFGQVVKVVSLDDTTE